MLLRRFQSERHRPSEVVAVHATGQRVVDICECLVERAPAHRDTFDLHLALGSETADDHGKFAGAILACGVVQKQIALVSRI